MYSVYPHRCILSSIASFSSRGHSFTRLRGRRWFTVLAVETSADDTCAAVISSERRVLSNVVIKQHSYHEEYGGIHPYVALNAHQRHLPTAIQRALAQANIPVTSIDGIAFTRGPGIGGCLGVGMNAAKGIAAALGKPIVGVHHMQAHALTAFLSSPSPSPASSSALSPPSDPAEPLDFPFLTLLVSGGHTLLLLATDAKTFRILATTSDEALGRAIDKVSRDLNLPWGSFGPGAALEDFCGETPGRREELDRDVAEQSAVKFAPAIPGRLGFSFTGLHSRVERFLSQLSHSDEGEAEHKKRAVARTFQRAVFGQLEEKVVLGLQKCRNDMGVDVRRVVVSGGVASNSFLRYRLRKTLDEHFGGGNISLIFPPPALCTDNAAMIGWAAMYRFLAGDTDDYECDLKVKWSIEELSASKE